MSNILSYISALDVNVLYAVQSIGPTWKPVAMFLSYGLGYPVMIAVFAIALFLMRKHRVALELIVVFFASGAIALVLKHLFQADRPYMIDPRVIVYDTDSGYGLPSVHALLSVIILGWIAVRHPKSHTVLWGSVAMIVLIGLSRVYLGVHYPSQVVAGWLFGILFLYIFLIIDKRLWAPFKKRLK